MRNIFLSSLLLISFSCSSQKSKAPEDPFKAVNLKGCFLLYNVKTNTFEKKLGETCEQRLPACSTFKVPLAVIAFDAKILKDENQILKWDGKKRWIDAWNQDHNAKSWMSNSVVWFSQRLTPKLGKKRLQTYLNRFNYGNKDLSTGFTEAWLNRPNDPRGSLAISAYEQVDFLQKLWKNDLPVAKRAMELTQQITYLETSPYGFQLHGKTGSNFYDDSHKVQLGWFIARVSKGDQEYFAVTNLSDLAPTDSKLYGGQRAKEFTKNELAKAGLW